MCGWNSYVVRGVKGPGHLEFSRLEPVDVIAEDKALLNGEIILEGGIVQTSSISRRCSIVLSSIALLLLFPLQYVSDRPLGSIAPTKRARGSRDRRRR